MHEDFGGDEALARLRFRMKRRGLRLMLDFVPNHMAPDHPWVARAPRLLRVGDEGAAGRTAAELLPRGQGQTARVLAYGRDPYFDGWPDTLQLNYGEPGSAGGDARRAARASRASATACAATWRCSSCRRCSRGRGDSPPTPFWPRRPTQFARRVPGFLFIAEVYWDLEWTLQQQGFDYTYDKRLYDRLVEGDAAPVREHLFAGLDFQDHLARFLENHDEPRAAATFAPDAHQAAAVLTFLTPGLRFFHQGQREGKRVRIPVAPRPGPGRGRRAWDARRSTTGSSSA